ncbi:MAG: AAA family ATPase, partial [Phycisphaerae bacterium]
MSLFKGLEQQQLQKVAPLPVRMRPTSLEEFVGQDHFLGPGKLLRRMLEADRLSSAIFYGPPGTGKTTLGQIIANRTKAEFYQVHAAGAGVNQIRRILEHARVVLANSGRRSVLFVDELHRFNRAQQDVLLSDVEDGIIILIGATTQNPFFVVNSPLVSRSQIFQFHPLTNQQIKTLLLRSLKDRQRGLGQYDVHITDQALEHLAVASDGDARRALTALEVGVMSQVRSAGRDDVKVHFDLEVAQESIQQKAVQYDA